MTNLEDILKLYNDMLSLHIKTKSTDKVFHDASQKFYETLFSAFHDAAEAMQDSKQEKPVDGNTARKEAYNLLEQAKKICEGITNENKDMGVDNVLRGLVDKLGFDCGTARGLADKNADDKPEDKESDNEDKSENDEDEAEEQVEEDEEEAGYESDDTGGYTVGKKPEYKNPNHSPNKFDRGNRFGGDKKDEAPKKKFKYPESGDMMG